MTADLLRAPRCDHPNCGAPWCGCQILGCTARIALAEAALTSLPEEVLHAFEHGAPDALLSLDGDLGDAALGLVAAAAVSGFLATLPRGWRLVGPNGPAVRAWDMCRALEAWTAMLRQEIAARDASRCAEPVDEEAEEAPSL